MCKSKTKQKLQMNNTKLHILLYIEEKLKAKISKKLLVLDSQICNAKHVYIKFQRAKC